MAHQYLFFLGRESALGACEAWLVLENRGYRPRLITYTQQYMHLYVAQHISDVSFLEKGGGVGRVAQVLRQSQGQPKAEEIIPLLSPLAKKVTFGLSTINVRNFGKKYLQDIKKIAKQTGTKLNFVEPKQGDRLSSAQVLFNGLYRQPHAEVTIIKETGGYITARTIWVQDIQAYEKRDTARPARDAYVGMLPPKLAQTLLSLATAGLPQKILTIYDPFCGLGTIIQEGMLDGYQMVGSDKAASMVEATRRNVEWVQKILTSRVGIKPSLFVQDVTAPFPAHLTGTIDIVVTEPFLGTPLSARLEISEAESYLTSLQPLYAAFLQHIRPTLREGGVLLVVLPAVKTVDGQFHVMPKACLDAFASIGYSLEHLVPDGFRGFLPSSERKSLFYARPDAIVGRELSLWRKY